jgi:hypothetical protein
MLNEFQSAILFQGVGYFVATLLGVFILNFLSSGFILTMLKVKASRGKKLLVRIRTPLNDYFKVGEVLEGNVIYKNRKGDKITMKLPKYTNAIFRSWNMNCIDVDEEKNAIVCVDFNPITGYDAQRFDQLLTRALMKPQAMNKFQKIIVILIIFGVIVAFVGDVLSYQAIAACKVAVNNTGVGAVAGGNIPAVVAGA